MITVRPIDYAQHLAFLTADGGRADASFLQTPAWGRVKAEWRSESIGFFDGEELIGVGLVLLRKVPKLNRWFAYLPEGPVLDWGGDHVEQALQALARYLKKRGAFAIRIGPTTVSRRWHTATVKAAIAEESVRSLEEVPADEHGPAAARLRHTLRHLKWQPPKHADGFAAGQPKFNFWLPLAGKTEDEVLKGMNQLWRRNIKKAAKLGVEVTTGTAADLPAFHRIYVETAERDGFTPRALSYFENMVSVMSAEDPDRIRIYLAHHEGDLVAATLAVRVGRHAWYSYGASTGEKREVRGSNAVQWQMIRDALAAGCAVYDLRGITDSVANDDPHLGLIQFKVGTGGEAVEYPGEWDLPINPVLHKAFNWYLNRK
ncbi:lipid II:glycine glycyltransferase FemX [Naumannella halotolerans]|uniref:lipid II:glycine glycyltransferase FemX n=1 Tax=Naumannella halotolerans TaxID=993414 RepID=UPI00105C83CA